MTKSDVFFIMATVYFAKGISGEMASFLGYSCLALGFVVLWWRGA